MSPDPLHVTTPPDLPHPMGQTVQQQPPLFLARETYRHRRLIDAARLLPFIVAALWLVPTFWTQEHRTAVALLYLFGVWFAVIGASALLARRLKPARPQQRADPE